MTCINEKAGKQYNSGANSKYPDNQRCKVLAINKVNHHIALATNEGELQIRESAYMLDNMIFHQIVAKEKPITCLSYSPNGNELAVGAQDNSLHIWSVEIIGKYKEKAVIPTNEQVICDIDWSNDGSYLRGNTKDLHIFFFNTDKKWKLIQVKKTYKIFRWSQKY